MKLAATVFEGSISTVCDFSSCLWLFDIEAGEARNRSAVSFASSLWPARVQQLKGLDVGVLLCGALSRPLERMLQAAGIEVVPWLCGPVEEILPAYLQGLLPVARFVLPGCGHRGGGPQREVRGCGRRTRAGLTVQSLPGCHGAGKSETSDRGRR